MTGLSSQVMLDAHFECGLQLCADAIYQQVHFGLKVTGLGIDRPDGFWLGPEFPEQFDQSPVLELRRDIKKW